MFSRSGAPTPARLLVGRWPLRCQTPAVGGPVFSGPPCCALPPAFAALVAFLRAWSPSAPCALCWLWSTSIAGEVEDLKRPPSTAQRRALSDIVEALIVEALHRRSVRRLASLCSSLSVAPCLGPLGLFELATKGRAFVVHCSPRDGTRANLSSIRCRFLAATSSACGLRATAKIRHKRFAKDLARLACGPCAHP